MSADREPIICDYCGDVGWTVERYGRVTHKRQCPHRRDPWSQTYPQQASFKDQVGEQEASDPPQCGADNAEGIA